MGLLLALGLIALWGACFIGLISPNTLKILKKNKPLTRKDIAIVFFIGTLIFLCLISFFVSNETNQSQIDNKKMTNNESKRENEIKQPSLFDQIKDYDKASVLGVRNHGENVLEIDLKATEVTFSDSGYIDFAGHEAKDILIKLVKNHPNEKYKIVRFVVIGNLTDKYNKTNEEPIFQLTYDLGEIKKINLDNGFVDYKIFLNFAKFGLRNPVAHTIYKEWCTKDKNGEKSGSFCDKSL